MTLEQIKEIMKASLDKYGCGFFGDDNIPTTLEVVETNEWEQLGKYQYLTEIVKDYEGNFFRINNNRSGSPFTDWDYGAPSISQVKPVEKIVKTIVWEIV